MKKKLAFTLAEVLITLGIIGVVAAITMPIVIQNYRKQTLETKLKADVSILQQAIVRSAVDNGTPDSWGLEDNSANTFEIYIKPYLNVVGECNGSVNNPDNPCNSTVYNLDQSKYTQYNNRYFLPNDSSIMFRAGGTGFKSQRRGIFMVIPKNKKEKLIVGKNAFPFNLIVQDNVKYKVTSSQDYFNSSFGTYYSKAKLIELCTQASTSYGYTFGIACSYLLESNTWKFPNDYPIKF